ncbi:MAG: protein-glutamate O-methyltransferase CheR [Acidobacteriota bacterium]|nr:protein-glutamate O-methyltransferase CheR [Acidobacteriota bacterium]
MPLTPEQFKLWQALLKDMAGIHLDEQKSYLLATRLSPLLNAYGFDDLMDLYAQAQDDWNGALPAEIVQVMTTHETNFFRHPPAYEFFADLLRAQFETQTRDRPLQVLSAGCSTGEEPWSLAMTAADVLGERAERLVRIHAWDIAPASLAMAREGVYRDLGKKVDPAFIDRYFQPHEGGRRIRDNLRQLVRFEVRNLLNPGTLPARFDIVFCKNVAIYFDPPTRAAFFEEVLSWMSPQGYLFIGSGESLVGVTRAFRRERHGEVTVYRPEIEPVARTMEYSRERRRSEHSTK